MPCSVCGANAVLYEGPTPIKFACGFTATEIAAGHHTSATPRRGGMPPAGFVAIAFVVLIVVNGVLLGVGDASGFTDADATLLASVRALTTSIQILGLFALYAGWRAVRALEARA